MTLKGQVKLFSPTSTLFGSMSSSTLRTTSRRQWRPTGALPVPFHPEAYSLLPHPLPQKVALLEYQAFKDFGLQKKPLLAWCPAPKEFTCHLLLDHKEGNSLDQIK